MVWLGEMSLASFSCQSIQLQFSCYFSEARGKQFVLAVVDGNNDQPGAFVGESMVNCRAQIARPSHDLTLPAEGVGQLLPVWIAKRHIDVAAVLRFLLPCDEAIVAVFPDHDSDPRPEPFGRFHFVHIHEEVAVASDSENPAFGMDQMGGDGAR